MDLHLIIYYCIVGRCGDGFDNAWRTFSSLCFSTRMSPSQDHINQPLDGCDLGRIEVILISQSWFLGRSEKLARMKLFLLTLFLSIMFS